jgi:DNA-binding Lrp family transcriptional regulator
MSEYRGGGYIKLRRGILSHLQTRRLSVNEFTIFVTLLVLADIKTGVVEHTSQKALAELLGMPATSVRGAMKRLEDKGYILRAFIQGHKEWYAVLCDKYEITDGKYKNFTVSIPVTKTVYSLCEGALNMEKRKELQDKILEAVRCPCYVEYGVEDGETVGVKDGVTTVSRSIIKEVKTLDGFDSNTYKKSSSGKSGTSKPKTSPGSKGSHSLLKNQPGSKAGFEIDDETFLSLAMGHRQSYSDPNCKTCYGDGNYSRYIDDLNCVCDRCDCSRTKTPHRT